MAKIARFQFPDGRIGRFEVPDDYTPEQAQAEVMAFIEQQGIPEQDPPVEPASQKPAQKGRMTARGTRTSQPRQTYEGEGSFLNSVARGASFGLNDELSGLVGAGVGKLTGDLPESVSFGDAYRGIRDEVRADEAAYAEANPRQAMAGEIAGGLLTGGALAKAGLKALPKGATIKRQAATGSAIGAAEGGAYGAGTSTEGERLEGAAEGALKGALGGYAAGAAGGLIGKKLADRAIKARKIKAGSASKDLAKYRLNDTGSISRDPNAKRVISQGFDEGFVQQLKTASPADKKKILKMVRMGKIALKNNRFAMNNRINQVVGESLAKRVNMLNDKMREASNNLDNVAKSLKGRQVDYEGALNDFVADLQEMDIRFSNQGGIKVDLSGSMIEGADDAANALNRILNRLVNTKTPDAYDVHRAKRFIDNMVKYGKGQEKGLKGEIINVIKRLRHNLDKSLDETFPVYNKVNTQYADNRQALDALQDAWGGRVDMFAESAPKQLGIQSRKLLSNYSSGANQLDAIENAEKVIRKYGGELDDNIMDQAAAESALRQVLPQKYFNTFQGDMEKAGGNLARAAMGDKVGMATAAMDKIGGMFNRKSPEAAMDALEALLKDSI